jgi:glycosyltransferase involved in cell wall biosynthesis
MTIEIAHGSLEASGYRSLVIQIEKGMKAVGEPTELVETPPITARMTYAPKTPVLVDISDTPGLVMPRWVDRTTMAPVKIGTRFRRWVTDRDMPWIPDATTRVDVSGYTRDATRILANIPEYADWGNAARRILFTMWESSELPKRFRPWAPHLRQAQLILVPSEHSRRLVRDVVPESKIKVRTVPLALEKEAWPYVDRGGRSEDAPFIFLLCGDLSTRKGFHLAYQAFMDLFEHNPNVHLILKTRGMSDLCAWSWWPKHVPLQDADGAPVRGEDGKLVMLYNKERVRWKISTRDPNVHILRGDWSRRGLMQLYRAADCFLWPSFGEGWGYPPREAAATGLPVITCSHTGMADAGSWARVIPHSKGKTARYTHWGPSGHWYQPDLDALKAQMLWVYENRAAGLDLGLRASEYVTKRTPQDLALDILEAAAEIGHPWSQTGSRETRRIA